MSKFTPEKEKVIIEHLLITKNNATNQKHYSHVPCKFFKNGNCQAGSNCPFSHDLSNLAKPCKYHKLGNCKFGSKCANLHTPSTTIMGHDDNEDDADYIPTNNFFIHQSGNPWIDPPDLTRRHNKAHYRSHPDSYYTNPHAN